MKKDYILIGEEFWSFVGGDIATQSYIFDLIRNIAKGFSFTDLVKRRTKEILEEYNSESKIELTVI